MDRFTAVEKSTSALTTRSMCSKFNRREHELFNTSRKRCEVGRTEGSASGKVIDRRSRSRCGVVGALPVQPQQICHPDQICRATACIFSITRARCTLTVFSGDSQLIGDLLIEQSRCNRREYFPLARGQGMRNWRISTRCRLADNC